MIDALKWPLALLLAMSAPMVQAAPLTIRTGETWVFTIKEGQPTAARKVEATAMPARGQIVASVRAFLGTALTVTNNSATAYTFRAELMRRGKVSAARSCAVSEHSPGRGKACPGRALVSASGDRGAAHSGTAAPTPGPLTPCPTRPDETRQGDPP